MLKQAVILVGGKGTRLRNLTKRTLKPLIKIDGQPFLEIILKNLSKYYFDKIYLMAGYKADKIIKKYHNKKILFSKIIVIKEKKPLGTAGCLSLLKKKISSDFLLLNGDSFFDIDLNFFTKKSRQYLKKKMIGTIALVNNQNYKSNKKLSNLIISKKKIICFSNKKSGLMNAGIYYFKRNFLDKIARQKISLEEKVLPRKIFNKQIIGFRFKNNLIDIGLKKNLKIFKSIRKKKNINQKCIFLDRDGVINKENGYITSSHKFILNKGVGKAINFLNKKNILVIIITNQSAIARGFITENKLEKIHKNFCIILKKKNDAHIDDIYFCPYLKNAKINKYKKDSYLRKPRPGMIYNALRDWKLKKSNCIMIGDKITDEKTAKNAGINFYYKKKNSLYEQVKKYYQ